MNTTTVTATITDRDGQIWANGKYTFTLYNPSFPSGPFTNGGVTLTSTQLIVSGSMNASGVISTTLFDVSQTQPYGSVYLVSLCSNTSAPCVSAPSISPAGATQDFSAALSAGLAGPRLYAGASAFAYADVEILGPPSVGQTYFNVVSNLQRIWNGTAWVTNGSTTGGGAPSGPAGGDLGGAYPNPTVAGIANATLPSTFSAPGAASQSGVTISGAPFTGGTGTTTKPQLYLDSGSVEPTTWITNGTVIGINAPSGYNGYFTDFRVNGGNSVFNVGPTGLVTTPNLVTCSQVYVPTSTPTALMGTNLIRIASGAQIGWSSNATNATVVSDTTIWRQSAGVVQINSGSTAGSTGSLKLGQLLGGSGAPTIAAGPAAGTGATVTVTGNNNAGSINLTTGTSPASGVLATLTFNVAGTYPTSPYVSLTAGNSATAGVLEYVTSTTTTFVLNVGTALTASTVYVWNYLVMG